MPDTAKQLVIEHLESGKFIPAHLPEITNVIQFIKNGASSDGSEFIKWMKIADQYRDQNFSDTHKEIAQAIGY
jgi:hypothetical protein